ncbi:dihydrofolate reductase family protein [uncultured Roseibium sp.]|uniref:dihydrofolate reductase family protein n=1 Tax=uncultured Roseibium sp. TaxID=1936171 RepID=UPI00260DF50D|nr:dihydrofolate reductase family protein [uncultured Roseibium sp.]
MQPIIYDVAVSVDGFIAGADDDITKFAHEGPVVEDYFERLSTYAIAVMGRNTYEFGYRFGLEPGANPYQNMRTYVFSRSLELPEESDVEVVGIDELPKIKELKAKAPGPIYLCGGGEFAGHLLSNRLIDTLRLKRAPILLGSGVKLFGCVGDGCEMVNTTTRTYDGGYLFQEFQVQP